MAHPGEGFQPNTGVKLVISFFIVAVMIYGCYVLLGSPHHPWDLCSTDPDDQTCLLRL